MITLRRIDGWRKMAGVLALIHESRGMMIVRAALAVVLALTILTAPLAAAPKASVTLAKSPAVVNWYVVGLPRGSTRTVATTLAVETLAVHGLWLIGPPAASLKSWRLAGAVAISAVT